MSCGEHKTRLTCSLLSRLGATDHTPRFAQQSESTVSAVALQPACSSNLPPGAPLCFFGCIHLQLPGSAAPASPCRTCVDTWHVNHRLVRSKQAGEEYDGGLLTQHRSEGGLNAAGIMQGPCNLLPSKARHACIRSAGTRLKSCSRQSHQK